MSRLQDHSRPQSLVPLLAGRAWAKDCAQAITVNIDSGLWGREREWSEIQKLAD